MSETTRANPGVERFRRQLRAESLANELAIKSIESVSAHMQTSPEYDRAVQLLPHNQLARAIWLSRLRGEPFAVPADWFPAWPLAETRERAAAMDRGWAEYLDSISDADLTLAVSFKGGDGQMHRKLVEDILIHVFNHSTYHRGQLARCVAHCAGQRAMTDYIRFAEEPTI